MLAYSITRVFFFEFSEAEAKHLVFESDQDQDNQLTKVRHLHSYSKLLISFGRMTLLLLNEGCLMLLLLKHLRSKAVSAFFQSNAEYKSQIVLLNPDPTLVLKYISPNY